MAAEDRTLTQLCADLHTAASRLDDPVGGAADTHELRNHIAFLAEHLAASGVGNQPAASATAGAERARAARNLHELTAELHTDLAKLAVRMHEEAVPQDAVNQVTDRTLGMGDLALALKNHAAGSRAAPAHAQTLKINTGATAGTRPGERANSLDLAGRALEAALRARNERRAR